MQFCAFFHKIGNNMFLNWSRLGWVGILQWRLKGLGKKSEYFYLFSSFHILSYSAVLFISFGSRRFWNKACRLPGVYFSVLQFSLLFLNECVAQETIFYSGRTTLLLRGDVAELLKYSWSCVSLTHNILQIRVHTHTTV